MIYSDSFAIVIVMYIYSQYIYIMVLFLYKHAVKNFSVCFESIYKKKKYISSFRYTNWRFKILNRNWKTRNLIKIKHPTPYRNYRISSSF